MRFVKIDKGFYADLDEISVLIIEESKEFNEDSKRVEYFFNVNAITKLGQKIPIPLFSVKLDDKINIDKAQSLCEEFIFKNFERG